MSDDLAASNAAPPTLAGQRIALVGSGAVGTYYGARLAKLRRDVRFLVRSDYEYVRQHGWSIRSHVDGEWHLPGEHAYHSAEEIGPCDLVIIALKATANEALLEIIPPLLKPGTRLLTLQNGLGNEEFLAQHFGAERVLGGLCFTCINRIAPGVIAHMAEGLIQLGEFERPPGEMAHAIANDWRTATVPCQVVESLRWARWRKLVWNVPFNGLAIAAGGVPVDVIMASRELRETAAALMAEVIALAAAEGHAMPDGLVEDQIRKTAAMGPYKPSSLIDYLNGTAVELDAIWQAPLDAARELGVPTPCLQTLTAVLQQLCAKRPGARLL